LPPLRALQGLGINAAKNILQARQQSEFESIDELQQLAGLSKPVIDILKEHGVISHLPQSNQISLFEMGF
jgi:DNA polymerase-3 subunit alpha (Gram-positive type)